MKHRAIDPEESALWHDAMRGVARRRGAGRASAAAGHKKSDHAVPAKAGAQAPLHGGIWIPAFAGMTKKCNGGCAGIDRRQALRLKRGQLAIEARLDLHGMTQTEAHRALAAFVARADATGKRALLVVTGKGHAAGGTGGVLRAAVPRWLAEPALRERVLATAPATPRDGGSGALYVLLRRMR